MARFEVLSEDMAAMGSQQMNAEMLFELGMSYASGRDVAEDLVSAHKWFNLAAMKGYGDAARYRKEISEVMSSSDIAEAQRAAREWLGMH
ncbi:hypothetical protein C8N35_102152 [Breoghania corrubedonensis]|uniref:Sel1 repeat-containing protein n=1 Tax=Breoghania corrubedonensis TaxID=665038 RepID=A0A2T5VCH0_9HYPH|nr:sel1 repeat family protein [Breoghania corrubedonensis]PTW61442.1 hypothetical protein C8N35_102152 [Breoghania corrubedonensis]